MSNLCKFKVGQEISYRRFTPSGRPLPIKPVQIVEIREFPSGNSAAIGQTKNGERFWVYEAQVVS